MRKYKVVSIYLITSPTNKVYVGQSHNTLNRFNSYKNLHCKDQPRLYNSLKKHGPEAHTFEMLITFQFKITQEALDDYEDLFIKRYKQLGFELMNLRAAGSRGLHTEETRAKMRGGVRGRALNNIIHVSEDRIDRLRTSSGETPIKRCKIDKIRKRKAIVFTEQSLKEKKERCAGKNNGMYGRKHTEVAKKIMSAASKVRNSGINNPHAKSVVFYDSRMCPVKEFSMIGEAAEAFGIHRACVAWAAKHSKPTHGLIFKFKEA